MTETWWDGDTPHQVDAEIGPGLLLEGENILEVEEVGDTEAAHSMVMLNRFEVSHLAELVAEQGALEGSFSESGAAEVSGVEVGSGYVLDVTGVHPRWLTEVTELESGGVSFWAESGRSYLMVSKGSVKAPEVSKLQSGDLFPYFNSLSEELLKAEGKGIIAAFSPTGLNLNDPAHRFHKALLDQLVDRGHERLGDAVLAGQAAYAETGAFPELLSIYHLLGDPALRLR